MKTSADPGTTSGNHDDHEYAQYLRKLQFVYEGMGARQLFTTDAVTDDLVKDRNIWSVYLEAFPPEERQHHNCHACRRFIQTYGTLVYLATDGTPVSPFWNTEAPGTTQAAVNALREYVESRRVTGVFLTSEAKWGQAVTGIWTHLNVVPVKDHVFKSKVLSAHQAMAVKRENYTNVCRGLAEFDLELLKKAQLLLQTDSLYRSEKVLGPVEWLYKLQLSINHLRGNKRNNLVWAAVASAPDGFCHPRSSMAGTLLSDLAEGLSVEDAAAKFKAKMDPVKYQRPVAPPAEGTIAQAEKLVAQLGIERSLERRYLRLDEVVAMWKPKQEEIKPAGAGVFDHLRQKNKTATPMRLPEVTMTAVKFAHEVLPTAERMTLHVPDRHPGYTALVTAVHPDAPPILLWDREEARNPVSWYFWVTTPTSRQFNLVPGTMVEVEALTRSPAEWAGPRPANMKESLLFVLRGAKDSRNGQGFFVESLRPELHGVRSVLEAHAKGAQIAGLEEPHVAGIALSPGGKAEHGVLINVVSEGSVRLVHIDRWD